MQTIYVSAVCLNEGQADSVAGIGVFFGQGNLQNYKGKATRHVQTTLHATLEGVYQALKRLDAMCDARSEAKKPTCAAIKVGSHLAVDLIVAAQAQLAGMPCNVTSSYPPKVVDVLLKIAHTTAKCGYNVSFECVADGANQIGLAKAHQMAEEMVC